MSEEKLHADPREFGVVSCGSRYPCSVCGKHPLLSYRPDSLCSDCYTEGIKLAAQMAYVQKKMVEKDSKKRRLQEVKTKIENLIQDIAKGLVHPEATVTLGMEGPSPLSRVGVSVGVCESIDKARFENFSRSVESALEEKREIIQECMEKEKSLITVDERAENQKERTLCGFPVVFVKSSPSDNPFYKG